MIPWRNLGSAAAAGLAIGLGLFFGGWMIGGALTQLRSGDRYVTVKGLAEREVPANLAVWPLTFKEAGNDLAALQTAVEAKRRIITAFLQELGIPAAEVSVSAPRVLDNQAEQFSPELKKAFRYIVQSTVLVRSANVTAVKQGLERSGALVAKGVVLVPDYENRTNFLYTDLNAIKPAMIEEATKNARQAAEKFAQDSGSRVGKIRQASQGLFTIENRDESSPDVKLVRVVTSVQYYLVDR